MKKRHILLIAALALTGLICVWLLTSNNVCIGHIENRTDDQWSHLHLYMNEEITVDFPVTEEDQICVFQWETGRGSFSAEITNADGEVLYSTTSEKNGTQAFRSSSDLTLRLKSEGHGGIFSLTHSDDPAMLADSGESKYHFLGDGTHSGGKFARTYECRKVDGKYLNFFVENLGSYPVLITINGEYARTIPAGSAGHIRASIASTIMAQSMTVECVSESGEELNIYWKAAQRDTA